MLTPSKGGYEAEGFIHLSREQMASFWHESAAAEI